MLFKRVILFISSYFPLYVIITIMHWDKICKCEENIIFVLLLFSAFIICVISVYLLLNTTAKDYIDSEKLENIEMANDTVISYIMTYVIPVISTGTENKTNIINIFLFILIGYLYIQLNLIYINPLWAMFGYLPYRTSSYIIISDIKYRDLKMLSTSRMKGKFITNEIILIHKKDNSLEKMI